MKTILLILILCFACTGCGNRGGMPPVAIEAATAKAQNWQAEILAIGTLSANQGVIIKPETSGRITAIYFHSGDQVKANGPLLQINPDIIKAQLAAAEARVTFSKANYNRIQTLFKKHVSSQSDLDTAFSSYQADAAAVSQYQAMLDQTLVRSPFEGRLGLRLVNLGDYVSMGQSITNIQDIDPLRVDFSIPEIYLSQIALGDEVLVYSQDFPHEVFHGKVYALDSSIDPNTRSLGVRAIVPNKDQKLLPGAFVEIKLLTGKVKQVVTIPEIALGNDAEGSYVYKIKDNMASKTKVVAGEHKNNQVVILDGLKTGDQVVAAGMFKIATDQAPIIIIK